ncbi:MAG: DUF2807 domain-containing protein [Bacteroidetes bacterium]|nr:DUF2807 domain-containing protein [Bacteroidota bacterium]
MKNNKYFFAIIFVTGLFLIVSCSKDSRPIRGDGPIVRQYYTLPDISGIALSIDANVHLVHGDTQEVYIEGQQNIIDNIEKYVDTDGFWYITYDRNVRDHAGVNIYLTTSMVDYIHVSGSGSVSCQNIFPDTVNVDLNISGSGNISMILNAEVLRSTISGSGEINVSGSAYEHQIHISGSGNIKAFDLPTYITYVNISGSGYTEVNVENLLDVHISGSGDVYYVGNPTINSDISGSGSIHNSN